MGSFLNVVVWRLPRGEKLTGRSMCPHCGHTLDPVDLVPFLSFALLKAKCRNCQKKISPRYPLVELTVGVLFVFTFLFLMPGTVLEWIFFARTIILVFFLTAIFIIDLEHFLILDSIILVGSVILTVLNLVLDFYSGAKVFSLASFGVGGIFAGLLAALPFFAIWFFSKGLYMGFGDVKLAIFLGIALGLKLVWVAVFLGVLLGGIVSIFLLFGYKKDLKTKLPFGTFLALGAFIAIFYGSPLLKWYLAILGI
jgi:leader peptidase (prepilin peptidase)/N-methyltransferase